MVNSMDAFCEAMTIPITNTINSDNDINFTNNNSSYAPLIWGTISSRFFTSNSDFSITAILLVYSSCRGVVTTCDISS